MILEERNTRTQQMQNMGLELSVVLGKEKTNKAGVVLSLVLYIPDRGNQLIIQLNPASRAVTSGHTEGISPQCLHCQAENKDTKPGCLPPPSQSSAPLPPPSVYRKGMLEVGQVQVGNHHNPAPQTNLCLTK